MLATKEIALVKNPKIYFTSDDIYNYSGTLAAILRRIQNYRDYQIAEDFIDTLKVSGLSQGRIVYYASRLPKLLRWFDNNIALKDCTKEDIRKCLSFILDEKYDGDTKKAYAIVLKRLVHFAKTKEIGRKSNNSDYCDEVRWIVPSNYATGDGIEIKPSQLLTDEELIAIFNAVGRVSKYAIRDVPMVICFYEGAFRPGEILQMRIGGIIFKQNLAEINTTGKTGQKTAPVVLAYRPLLKWLEQHPYKDGPEAPVWWSFKTNGPVGYHYLRKLVKRAAIEAGIKKNVWNYLLRHTKLTKFAKKHPTELLKKLGNWRKGTRMMDVYVHLSNEDLEDAILAEHGLKKEEEENSLSVKACPRCNEQCTDVDVRCGKCGLILDQELAMKVVKKEDEYRSKMQETIKKLERQMNQLMQMYQNVLRQNDNNVKDELQHH